MFAVFPATVAFRHNGLPSAAPPPPAPPVFPSTVTYCSTPPALDFTIELYPAPPQFSTFARQTSAPVVRSSATTAASSDPGVQTIRSPSISGLSLKPQCD